MQHASLRASGPTPGVSRSSRPRSVGGNRAAFAYLQHTIGNQAVQRLAIQATERADSDVGSDVIRIIGAGASQPPSAPAPAPVSGAVIQRILDEKLTAGARIKVWVNDGVQEVTLAKDFKPGDQLVVYREPETEPIGKNKTRAKSRAPSKPKTVSISAQLAFPFLKKNTDIVDEVSQHEQTKDVEHPSFGALTFTPVVLSYLVALAKQYQDKYELELDITEARVKLAGAAVDDIAAFLTDDVEDPLRSLKEAMSGEDAKYIIGQFMGALGQTGSQRQRAARGGSPNPKSKEEWKSKKTQDLKAALLEALQGTKGADILSPNSTLHHKLSRSRLKIMLGWLKATPSSTPGVTEMWQFIGDVERLTGKNGNPEDALCNWTANIELGVYADVRAEGDDPGDRFDGSYLKGVATPRTAQLQEAALILEKATGPSDIKWSLVAQYLSEAQTQHAQLAQAERAKPDALTLPHLEMWVEGDDGTFTRTKPAGATNTT